MTNKKQSSYFGEEKSKRILDDLFSDDDVNEMKFSWQTDEKDVKNLTGNEDINMPRQQQKDSILDSDNLLISDSPKCIFCGGELTKNHCPVCDFKFKKAELFAPITPNSFIFSELKSDDDIFVITPIIYWRRKKSLMPTPFKVPESIFLNCGINPTPHEPSKFSKIQINFELPTEEYVKGMEKIGFIWDKKFNKFVNKI
jgi:hypothetical protein